LSKEPAKTIFDGHAQKFDGLLDPKRQLALRATDMPYLKLEFGELEMSRPFSATDGV
jgi:hypothetical protein